MRVKSAHDAAVAADLVVGGESETEQRLAKEAQNKQAQAQQLHDENPFQHQMTIQKMRKIADELAAAAAAAAARRATADETAKEWRRVRDVEEEELRRLVEEATPLLESSAEAVRLLDWRWCTPVSPHQQEREHPDNSQLPPTHLDEHNEASSVSLQEAAASHTANADAGGAGGHGVRLPPIAPFPGGVLPQMEAREQQQDTQEMRGWGVSRQGSMVIEARHGSSSVARTASAETHASCEGISDNNMSDNASRSSWDVSSTGLSASAAPSSSAVAAAAAAAGGNKRRSSLANLAATSEEELPVNRGSRPRAQVLSLSLSLYLALCLCISPTHKHERT